MFFFVHYFDLALMTFNIHGAQKTFTEDNNQNVNKFKHNMRSVIAENTTKIKRNKRQSSLTIILFCQTINTFCHKQSFAH